MKIKRAVLSHFGKWETLTLEFSEYWTSIQGQNESGKSTIHDFIIAILFGFKGLKHRNLSQDAGGYLIVEHKNKDYRIERYMHQNHKKATVIRLEDHQVLGHDEMILEMIGLTKKEAMAIYIMDGYFLQQQKVTEDEWQRYVLSYAMSGSDRLFKLEQQYQKEMRAYFKNRGKQGLIPESIQAKKDLEDYIERLAHEDATQTYISDRDYEQKIVEKVKKEEELSAFKQYQQLKEELLSKGNITLSEEELSTLKIQISEWETLACQHAQMQEKTLYQEALSDYRVLQETVRIYQQAERKRRIVSQLYPKLKQQKQQTTIQTTLQCLGGGLVAVGMFLSFYQTIFWGIGLVIFGIILLFFAPEIIHSFNKEHSEYRYSLEQISKQVGERVESYAQVENFLDVEDEKRRLNQAIQKFSIYFNVTGESMQEQLKSIQLGMRQLKQNTQNKRDVSTIDTHRIEEIKHQVQQKYPQVEGQSLEAIKSWIQKEQKKRQNSTVEKTQLQQLEKQYPQIALWNLEQLESEYQSLLWEIQSMQKKRKEQEERPVENLESLRQSLCQVQEQLIQYMIEYEKLALKLNWVRDIKEKGEKNQLPTLLQRASQYFRVLTSGRYDQIKFEQNEIKIIREPGRIDQLHTLSNGTRAQLIISLRLAFITRQKEVDFPIIMDESWAFFDTGRQEQLFKLLQSLSQTHQIITFSNDDLTTLADHVIEL